MQLQVLTANIGGYRNANAEALDADSITAATRAILPIDPAQPLIMGLQEVLQVDYATQQIDMGASLAGQLGGDFRSYFGVEADSHQHNHAVAWTKGSFTGAQAARDGNGILTNLALSPWPWPTPEPQYPAAGSATPIAVSIGRPTLHSRGTRDTKPRNLLIASLTSPFGGRLYFMTTHLSTLSGEDRHDLAHPTSARASAQRLREVRDILGLLDELREAEAAAKLPPSALILAGDFNARPDTPEMQALATRFKSLSPTLPIGEGDRWTHLGHKVLIDHIWVDDPDGNLPAAPRCFIHAGAEIEAVTDHRPVLAVFEV